MIPLAKDDLPLGGDGREGTGPRDQAGKHVAGGVKWPDGADQPATRMGFRATSGFRLARHHPGRRLGYRADHHLIDVDVRRSRDGEDDAIGDVFR